MRLFLTGLFMACLVSISYAVAGCPPVITNGKLHGLLPIVNQKVSYSEVADCGAVSQADLFRRTRLWATQAYHSPGDTFTLVDKETGDLVGRVSQVVTLPRSEHSAGGVYTFQYTLIIECSNRRYRATITELEVTDGGAKPTPIETYCQQNTADLRTIYTALDQQIKDRLASLQAQVKDYKSF